MCQYLTLPHFKKKKKWNYPLKASCGINYSSSSREMVTLLVCGLNEQFDFNCTERRYRLWARKPDICSPVKKKTTTTKKHP